MFGMATAILSLAVLPCVATAQVTFTVTGTINTTAEGFTAGDVVTFSWTLIQSPSPGQPGSVNNVSNFYWIDETAGTDSPLFASVTGSPLSGTYVRSSSSPASRMSVASTNMLSIKSGNWSDPLGLTYNGNAVTNITMDARFTGLTFDLSTGVDGQPPPDANTYFATYAGTYTELDYSSNNNYFFWVGIDTNVFEDGLPFTPTSLTIAVGAVPEPSTYAAILGAAALVGAGVLRRRTKRA